MALVLADRVRETTTTTGTGSVTLAGAYTGFQTFSSAVGNGNSTYYTIANVASGEWEVGIGTYTSGGNTLSRTTVLASSNGGSLVNFGAGAKDVFVTQPAERALYIASAGTGLESKVTAFTNGGIVYASSTSALTTGSALTFDGGTVANINGGGTGFSTQDAASNFSIMRLGTDVANGYAFFQSGKSGTGTTLPFAWRQDSSELMRLTSTGLGIGTSSPAFKLDVASTQGVFRLQSTTGTNSVYLLTTNGGGDFYFGRENSTGSTFGSNTGYASVLYSAGAYPIVFLPNGTEKMRLDASGNLGLGVTPLSSGNGVGYLEMGNGGVIGARGGSLQIGSNVYATSGTFKYASSNYATLLSQISGAYYFGIAPSGTAGNAITFTTAMTLDASGNLGIGVTSITQKLQVLGNISAFSSSNAGSAGSAIYYLGAADAKADAQFKYDSATRNLSWKTAAGASDMMTLDASGNLLVGKTNSTGINAGAVLTPTGGFTLTKTDTSASDQVIFYRGIAGSEVYVGTITTTGTATSYVTSSDYRLKNTIAPMTGALAKVAALKPVTYKWNADGSDGEGFIAHELAEVCPHAVTGEKDGFDAEGNPKYQGIDTSFLVATLTAALQELKAEFDAYKASHP
jgi:hypothetical protein